MRANSSTFTISKNLLKCAKHGLKTNLNIQVSSPATPCSLRTPAWSTWGWTLSASGATRRRGRRWRSQPGPPSSGEQAAGGALCAEDTSPTPPTTKSFHSTARVKSSSLTIKSTIDHSIYVWFTCMFSLFIDDDILKTHSFLTKQISKNVLQMTM